MKRFLLSYDVHSEHERIINELTASDWHSIIKGFGTGDDLPVISYLPETTWWCYASTREVAFDSFMAIAGHQNVKRANVCEFVDWIGTLTNPMKHQIEEEKALRKPKAA